MQNKKTYFSKALILLVVVSLLFSTACTKGGSSTAVDAYKSVKLVYWGVWDDQDTMKPLFDAYKKIRPNVTIEYRKFRYDEYETKILEALAEDRGPDIMSLHNTWMRKYQKKLVPAPVSVKIPVKTLEGAIKKEEVVNFSTVVISTPSDVAKKFLDVVAPDVVMLHNTGTEQAPKMANKVFGLPISMDTLVLYYNRDLLNNAGIIEPPTNWDEFQEQVKKITKIDQATGEIILSGAAIGTGKNVARSFDLLSLLMMQNLAPMTDDRGAVAFNSIPRDMPNIKTAPGIGALDFYTQFASPLYEGYCWNDKQLNSLDAFIKGKTAFFFGYAYNRPTIVTQAPKLKFGIVGVPQVGVDQKVNYANYWVQTVSTKSKNQDYAWDFIQFASSEANVEKYLMDNRFPTALRSTKMINKQLAEPDLAPFAEQLLTAKSWYKGYDSASAEKIFTDMIDNVLQGTLTSVEALKQGAEKTNRTFAPNI